MEAATVPEQEQDHEQEPEQAPEGAPTEDGAEATRTAANLFQYSGYVHVGTGAEECEDKENGKCRDSEHFHGWLCMPNALQARDIEEKARAAKARRKRAYADADSDAAIMLEAQIDELLEDDRKTLIEMMAEREVRKQIARTVEDVRAEEKWEHYGQDKEEYERLKAMPEDDRPVEEFEALDQRMTEFGAAVEAAIDALRKQEIEGLKSADAADLRHRLREWQSETDSQTAYFNTFYMWLGFISTRRVGDKRKRAFDSIEEFRSAPPEVIDAIEIEVRELEGRLIRGEAAGN